MHARLAPVEHSFRYPAFVFRLDIDELAALARRLRLFGHDRRGLFSLHEGDYLGGAQGSLRDRLRAHLSRAGADIALDRVELVTTPRFAGYAFNPVSFFYCYGSDDALTGIVVEVNNTFGEAHVYPLPLADALDCHAERLRFVTRKRFHVSPFNDMQGEYDFRFAALGERLDVRIDMQREGGKSFTSRLSGRARLISDGALFRLAATYPLTAALTLPRIVWQAYKLHYRRKLPVHRKPEPSSPQTYAATRPAYISEFSAPSWLQRRGAAAATREDHASH